MNTATYADIKINPLSKLMMAISSFFSRSENKERASNKNKNAELVWEQDEHVYENTTIVFNPLSLDSLMATAILMNDPDLGKVKTVAYDRGGLLVANMSEKVIFVGLDPLKDDIDHILDYKRHVEILTYRDGCPWHKDKNTLHLEVIRPSDEYYDEITALTDNTVTKQVMMQYNATRARFTVPFLNVIDKAIRYCAMMETEAHSLPFPNAADAAEAVLAEKAAVHALRQTIGFAVSRRDFKTIQTSEDLIAYREHNHRLRLTLQKAMHYQAYGLGKNRKSIATMAVNEADFHEMAYTYQVVGKNIVGYEDIRGYRVWRICAKDRSVREMVAAYLKPEDRWVEGSFLCVLTKTPAMNVG